MNRTSLQQCSACGEQFEPQFDTCWSCGATLPEKPSSGFVKKPVAKKEVRSPVHQPQPATAVARSRSFVWVWAGLIAATLALVLGNVHIVTGGPFGGVHLVSRLSFGYSDIYVDATALGALPPAVAYATSPMAYLALYRNGLLGPEQHQADLPDAGAN